MPPKPGRDDGMAGSLKLPFLNLGEACAYVFGEGAIDGYTGHEVSRMSEPQKIGFGFTHALERCRIAGLHVDDNFPCVIIHRVPEAAVTVLHTSLLDVREEACWGWLPAVLLFCHNGGCVVLAEGSVGELGVAQSGADRSESIVGLPRPIGVAVLEHELVDREPPVLTAQEPDRQWLTLGDFPDGMPDITLIDVDLPGLREVEIFGPGIAVVADELYGSMPRPIFAAVEDVFTSNVPQDDWSPEDLLQFSHIINRGSGLMDPLLPIL